MPALRLGDHRLAWDQRSKANWRLPSPGAHPVSPGQNPRGLLNGCVCVCVRACMRACVHTCNSHTVPAVLCTFVMSQCTLIDRTALRRLKSALQIVVTEVWQADLSSLWMVTG